MFSKIDKEVIVILIIIIIVVALVGFVVYKYISGADAEVEDSAGGITTEDETQTQIEPGGIEIKGEGGGDLIICLDKCGDGVCQTVDANCTEGDFNCICPETPQECSQDCK